jgi:hypothetical protein
MTVERSCSDCSAGCSARHTEEKVSEEVAAGPYLAFAGVVIVLVSILLKWVF